MSVDKRALEAFQRKVKALRDDTPAIMGQLVIGEGVFAVSQAKQICKNDTPDVVDTGYYRENFHAGDKALAHTGDINYDGSKPRRSGTWYKIDVYNNADYAKHLEYGHRVVVVKKGLGKVDTGKYVRGRFVLIRAIKRTKDTQDARLQKKLDKIIADRLK